MGWDDSKKSGDGDAPATSFVRLPDKAERPAPRAPSAAPQPPPAWSPSAGPRPSPSQPPSDAPFGGFQSGSQTAMVRRQSDNTRFFAVLGVLVAVLVMGGAAVWLAFVLLKQPDPPPKTPDPLGQTGDVTTKPPVPDYVDDEEDGEPEVADPAATTGGKTGGKSTTTGKTGGKSTTGSTSTTGAKSTKGVSTTGRTPGNPRKAPTGEQ